MVELLCLSRGGQKLIFCNFLIKLEHLMQHLRSPDTLQSSRSEMKLDIVRNSNLSWPLSFNTVTWCTGRLCMPAYLLSKLHFSFYTHNTAQHIVWNICGQTPEKHQLSTESKTWCDAWFYIDHQGLLPETTASVLSLSVWMNSSDSRPCMCCSVFICTTHVSSFGFIKLTRLHHSCGANPLRDLRIGVALLMQQPWLKKTVGA